MITFTVNINLHDPNVWWIFFGSIYVFGLLVAANVARVYVRRSGYFEPQHLFGCLIWPLIAFWYVITFPSRFFR